MPATTPEMWHGSAKWNFGCLYQNRNLLPVYSVITICTSNGLYKTISWMPFYLCSYKFKCVWQLFLMFQLPDMPVMQRFSFMLLCTNSAHFALHGTKHLAVQTDYLP